MRVSIPLLCIGALALSACYTPSSGPQISTIYGNSTAPGGRATYELVEYDDSVLGLLKYRRRDTMAGHFPEGRSRPARVRVGVGDILSVSIYEAAAGGLFTPASTDTLRQGNYVTIPQQIVENDGTISIPFAGRVAARGKSTAQIESEIAARLRDRAIEPQIVVSLLDSRSSVYAVMGEVNTPGRFQIAWIGDRILAGISRAGGSKWPDFETSVTLKRDGKTATALLQTIIRSSQEDIYLKPGDQIYLRREPRFFTALGATGRSGHYPIDVPRLTLAEAIGRGQGLLDTQADPTGVFLLRWENREFIQKIGRKADGYPNSRIPTIYHFDLRDPNHLLATQQIDVMDKDVVYVTNAATVEARKAIQVLADLSYITFNAAATTLYVAP